MDGSIPKTPPDIQESIPINNFISRNITFEEGNCIWEEKHQDKGNKIKMKVMTTTLTTSGKNEE
jgi:hypothetical protein